MPEEEKEQTKINARMKTKHPFILNPTLTVLTTAKVHTTNSGGLKAQYQSRDATTTSVQLVQFKAKT